MRSTKSWQIGGSHALEQKYCRLSLSRCVLGGGRGLGVPEYSRMGILCQPRRVSLPNLRYFWHISGLWLRHCHSLAIKGALRRISRRRWVGEQKSSSYRGPHRYHDTLKLISHLVLGMICAATSIHVTEELHGLQKSLALHRDKLRADTYASLPPVACDAMKQGVRCRRLEICSHSSPLGLIKRRERGRFGGGGDQIRHLTGHYP
ncbi:hypothetical protein BKA64DRAFT_231421 [Cadophora sp. MPI-SDFR-AT-0126]|nr:hypothetical protein BKA64DRAFT_231421 [Leotiomycetes sp. MPI-SDFR-AT-0126]